MSNDTKHIYIFQNHVGLVKVGRSANVGQRKIQVQSDARCRIEIVHIYHFAGDNEEWLLDRLARFRLTGEWFDGSADMKAELASATQNQNLNWPFPLDEQAAAIWLTELELKRDIEARDRNFRRFIRILSQSSQPSHWHDMDIWRLLHPKSRQRLYHHVPENGKLRRFVDADGYNRVAISPKKVLGGWEVKKFVPIYTADIDDALSVWPDEVRPTRWDGTAIECCLAALKQRWLVWKSQPVKPSGRARFAGPNKFISPDARNRLLSHLI